MKCPFIINEVSSQKSMPKLFIEKVNAGTEETPEHHLVFSINWEKSNIRNHYMGECIKGNCAAWRYNQCLMIDADYENHGDVMEDEVEETNDDE